MKRLLVVVFCAVFVVQFIGNAQGHQSTEETEDSGTREEVESAPVWSAGDRRHHSGHSHESRSREQESRSSEERTRSVSASESDEDSDSSVKIPQAAALCPARPEEISKIETECAEEYRQWKMMRLKKMEQHTTTCEPTQAMEEHTSQSSGITSMEDSATHSVVKELELLQMTTLEEAAMTEGSTQEEEQMTTEQTTMPPTTTVVAMETKYRKKRSRKIIKKRSCYPATCILRKLNLLDNMGQPSIERIKSFAVNMTIDGSTNLEAKAIGCVREINEAMIDATGDIGKKVGCVALKIITCLNKGLICPIMKVPQ